MEVFSFMPIPGRYWLNCSSHVAKKTFNWDYLNNFSEDKDNRDIHMILISRVIMSTHWLKNEKLRLFVTGSSFLDRRSYFICFSVIST